MIVAYATKGPYEIPARALRESLEKLELEHQIDILPSRSSWRANSHIRPGYLLSKLADGHEWLLSLDADAIVLSDPLPYLKKLECDVAAHYIKKKKNKVSRGELLPGTLWLRNTDAAKKMLKLWAGFAEARPNRPDRFCCSRAINAAKRDGLVIEKLPPEYTYIFDTSKKLYPDAKPIIKHMQASRRLRK